MLIVGTNTSTGVLTIVSRPQQFATHIWKPPTSPPEHSLYISETFGNYPKV